MNVNKKKPLVSIGLPTYNRPDGLKYALDRIGAQTYTAIEIIVSDNCSNTEFNIKEIVEVYMKKDPRIVFYQQPVNQGAFYNFQFVLEKATGDFFMWFADDDDKSPDFIEKSLEIIRDAGGAFGTYAVKNYQANSTYVYKVPTILKEMPLEKQMFRFLSVFPSVYIYGLFRRESLVFFLKEKLDFDFSDGYFSMNILINYGLNVIPTEIPITILGVHDNEYVPKPFAKRKNRMFTYKPVLLNCYKLITSSKRLNFFWKPVILLYFFLVMLKQYITFEHKYRPVAWILNYLLRVPVQFIYKVVKK